MIDDYVEDRRSLMELAYDDADSPLAEAVSRLGDAFNTLMVRDSSSNLTKFCREEVTELYSELHGDDAEMPKRTVLAFPIYVSVVRTGGHSLHSTELADGKTVALTSNYGSKLGKVLSKPTEQLTYVFWDDMILLSASNIDDNTAIRIIELEDVI